MPYTEEISRGDAAALIPEEASDQIWSAAPQSSIIMGQMPTTQLQDASVGTVRVPVEDSLPEAYFRDGEDGLSENTGMSWKNVYLEIGEVVVDVIVKKTTLADSAFDIWGFCVPKVSEAIGRRFDKGVLYRLGTPDNWPISLLQQIINAGQTLDYSTLTGSGKDLYDIYLGEGGLMAMLEDDGFEPDGHIAALNMKAKMRGVRGDDGHPIFTTDPMEKGKYLLDGSPIVFPKNGAMDKTQTLHVAGQWKELAWCKRQDITMEIFRSGIIQNTAGQTIHNLNQQGKVNLQFTARLGWVLPNPVNAVNPDNATRHPFAALVP
jgi:hypothetical protein